MDHVDATANRGHELLEELTSTLDALSAQLAEVAGERDQARALLGRVDRSQLADATVAERAQHDGEIFIAALRELAATKPDSALGRRCEAWAVTLDHIVNDIKRLVGTQRHDRELHDQATEAP